MMGRKCVPKVFQLGLFWLYFCQISHREMTGWQMACFSVGGGLFSANSRNALQDKGFSRFIQMAFGGRFESHGRLERLAVQRKAADCRGVPLCNF